MAVEDAAVLTKLLGQLNRSKLYKSKPRDSIATLLKVYENLRKSRTTVNVRGARANRLAYHMHDGPLQENRDAWLRSGPEGDFEALMAFADSQYLRQILAFDAVEDSIQAFKEWEDSWALRANKI